MAKEQKSLLPGFVLVAVGTYLLLRKMGLVAFHWREVIPFVLILGGAFFLGPVFKRRDPGAAFWATALLLFGVFFLLRNYDIFSFGFHFYAAGDFWPVFLIVFGVSFIIQYLVKPDDWGILVPGAVLLFIGCAFLSRNLFWFDFSTYWPLLLIVIGVSLVINGYRKRQH